MPDADALEIRIAVGHCNQSEVLAQCLQRWQDVREQLDIVSRPIKHVKGIVDEFAGIPYPFRHVLENRLSQETKVMRLVLVLLHDLLTKRVGLVRGESLSDFRKVFAEPRPQLSFSAHNNGPDSPKCVIKIKRNGANTVQGMLPVNDLKTIVVL